MGDDLLKFSHRHALSELDLVPIYRTKQGVYFHNHIFTSKEYYRITPVKARITIEYL